MVKSKISQHTRAETETLLDCKTILSSDKSIMAENEPGKYIALASKLEPQEVQNGTHRDGLEEKISQSTSFSLPDSRDHRRCLHSAIVPVKLIL